MWSPHREQYIDLKNYVEQLMEPPPDGEPGDLRTVLDHQWGALCQAHSRMVAANPTMCTAGKMKANKLKNRHHDVLPNDKTRVKLQISDGGSDYINANFIDGKAFCLPQHNFITAQAPTRNTIADFWRMVWECDVGLIVMLTSEVERNKEKCARYWPELPTEENRDPCLVCEEFQIRWQHPEALMGPGADANRDGDIDIRQFYIFRCGTRREIMQLHHLAWPDHSVPEPSSTGFRDLVRLSNEYVAANLEGDAGYGPCTSPCVEITAAPACDNVSAGPILVHCSAGIGRTGCLIVVTVLAALYERHCRSGKIPAAFSFDVIGTIHTLRRQRAGMVQSLDQLQYVYLSLVAEVERIHAALGIVDTHKAVHPA